MMVLTDDRREERGESLRAVPGAVLCLLPLATRREGKERDIVTDVRQKNRERRGPVAAK